MYSTSFDKYHHKSTTERNNKSSKTSALSCHHYLPMSHHVSRFKFHRTSVAIDSIIDQTFEFSE